jgi:hypothetical protein
MNSELPSSAQQRLRWLVLAVIAIAVLVWAIVELFAVAWTQALAIVVLVLFVAAFVLLLCGIA